jgi:hypothetical protein
LWDTTPCIPGFLLRLLFDPKDGGDMFLWNVGWLSTEYGVKSQTIILFKHWKYLVLWHICWKPRHIVGQWHNKRTCDSGDVTQQWSKCGKRCFLRGPTPGGHWGYNRTRHTMSNTWEK